MVHLSGVSHLMSELEDIPPEISEFILEKIDSVPHLEALLLLWRDPLRVWTEESLAHSLYVTPSTARRIVQGLARRNWLKNSEVSGGFLYDGSWDAGGIFMARLSNTYSRHLVRIATLIHANASAAVREFADAFQWKKE
jgi:Mn-dependent DtxR family transcriptional regulator